MIATLRKSFLIASLAIVAALLVAAHGLQIHDGFRHNGVVVSTR